MILKWIRNSTYLFIYLFICLFIYFIYLFLVPGVKETVENEILITQKDAVSVEHLINYFLLSFTFQQYFSGNKR